VGEPADVTEPGSAGDHKHPITEGEDSSSHSDSNETYISRKRIQRFLEEPPIVVPPTRVSLGKLYEDIERSEPKKIKIEGFPAQDIPDDITCQRRQLQEFYTAWKKHKFGPSEESEDAGTSGTSATATDLKMPTPIETGLRNCEKLPSASDNSTSSFSQLSINFLLFANAYPKHAPTCYEMAEYCFKMATIASRVLSASWKLTHGFTLSSVETAIGEINLILINLTPTFLKVYLQLENLYLEYVKYVMNNETFERDEEFQMGHKQPPMESQISAFMRVAETNLETVLEVLAQMRKFVYRLRDPPKKGEVSRVQRMEVEEPDQPHTLKHVREYVLTLEEDLRSVCSVLNDFRILAS
jgi:hypothetical protein